MGPVYTGSVRFFAGFSSGKTGLGPGPGPEGPKNRTGPDFQTLTNSNQLAMVFIGYTTSYNWSWLGPVRTWLGLVIHV